MTKDMCLSIFEELEKHVPTSISSEDMKKMMRNIITVKTLQHLSKEELVKLCRKMKTPVTGTKEELAKKLFRS